MAGWIFESRLFSCNSQLRVRLGYESTNSGRNSAFTIDEAIRDLKQAVVWWWIKKNAASILLILLIKCIHLDCDIDQLFKVRAHRCSTLLPAYPCLLACLRVVLYKDGVRGRKVESPNAGLSLARQPVQETHIFHLPEAHTRNIRDGEMRRSNMTNSWEDIACPFTHQDTAWTLHELWHDSTDRNVHWAQIKVCLKIKVIQ